MNKLLLILLFMFIFPTVSFAEEYKSSLGSASENLSVANLQRYLMSANRGPDAQNLKYSGEKGYFDSYTQTALIEFQKSVFIHPANGYFSSDTAQYISTHPLSDNFGNIVLSPATTTITSTTVPQLPPSNIKASSVDINSWRGN